MATSKKRMKNDYLEKFWNRVQLEEEETKDLGNSWMQEVTNWNEREVN